MKTYRLLFLFLMATITIMVGCKKEDSLQDELSKLPPATQTGANTFGCLINGKVFVPKGYNGTGTPNPNRQIDIGLSGLPYFNITASQLDKEHVSQGNIFISVGHITGSGEYFYPDDFNFLAGWKPLGNCGIIAFDTTIYKWGYAILTKYDLTNRIISGIFNFKYKTLTCDTVYVTDGRFDFKF